MRSVVSESLRPVDCVVHQALLSMGFSRQEYWSGLPFPSRGDFTHPEIEAASPASQVDSLSLGYCGSLRLPRGVPRPQPHVCVA